MEYIEDKLLINTTISIAIITFVVFLLYILSVMIEGMFIIQDIYLKLDWLLIFGFVFISIFTIFNHFKILQIEWRNK